MKKLLKFFIIFIFAFMPLKALCYGDFVPSYTNSVGYFGEGAILVPNYTQIYEEKNSSSKIIQKLYWDDKGLFGTMDKEASRSPNDIFLTYSPSNGIVLLSAAEDIESGWYRVCYDQKKRLFGWIHIDENSEAKFYPYTDLFFKYGKLNGVRIFRNLAQDRRKLYSRPKEDSKAVDEFEAAKFVSPWLIQGNWMLVKVVTYDNRTKTGWFRWRGDDGMLYAFINVK